MRSSWPLPLPLAPHRRYPSPPPRPRERVAIPSTHNNWPPWSWWGDLARYYFQLMGYSYWLGLMFSGIVVGYAQFSWTTSESNQPRLQMTWWLWCLQYVRAGCYGLMVLLSQAIKRGHWIWTAGWPWWLLSQGLVLPGLSVLGLWQDWFHHYMYYGGDVMLAFAYPLFFLVILNWRLRRYEARNSLPPSLPPTTAATAVAARPRWWISLLLVIAVLSIQLVILPFYRTDRVWLRWLITLVSFPLIYNVGCGVVYHYSAKQQGSAFLHHFTLFSFKAIMILIKRFTIIGGRTCTSIVLASFLTGIEDVVVHLWWSKRQMKRITHDSFATLPLSEAPSIRPATSSPSPSPSLSLSSSPSSSSLSFPSAETHSIPLSSSSSSSAVRVGPTASLLRSLAEAVTLVPVPPSELARRQQWCAINDNMDVILSNVFVWVSAAMMLAFAPHQAVFNFGYDATLMSPSEVLVVTLLQLLWNVCCQGIILTVQKRRQVPVEHYLSQLNRPVMWCHQFLSIQIAILMSLDVFKVVPLFWFCTANEICQCDPQYGLQIAAASCMSSSG